MWLLMVLLLLLLLQLLRRLLWQLLLRKLLRLLWLLLLLVQAGGCGAAVEGLHKLHSFCKEGLELAEAGAIAISENAHVVGFLGGELEVAEDAPADVGGSRR